MSRRRTEAEMSNDTENDRITLNVDPEIGSIIKQLAAMRGHRGVIHLFQDEDFKLFLVGALKTEVDKMMKGVLRRS